MRHAITTVTILLIGVVGTISCPTSEASTPEPVLPELSSAAMSIPWSDFRELIRMLQPPAVPEEEKPPIDWTLASARYDGEVTADNTVRIRASMEIVVWKPKGWVRIPVIGDTVAPVSVTLDGKETSLSADETGWFTLMLQGPGRHELDISFFVNSTFEEGVVSFAFPCSRTPLTHLKLKLPTPDAGVHVPAAASVLTEKGTDSLTAEVVFRPTSELAVNWTLPTALRKPKPVEEARVTCLTSTLASVTERYITCESRLHYDVLRGSLDTFRLRLPSAVNVLTVTGQGAAWSRSESDGTQLIEVKTNHLVTDRYELVLRYEAPFENEIVTVKVPELLVEDIVRETGYIGVTARGNVELNASAEVEGLTRVDISDLPTAVRAMSPNPILLAFKYTEHPYLLAMDVRKLADVPVRVASIDRAEFTTVVTDEGMVVTRAAYDVRNNVKQFLRVDVGENAEIWGAEVGGRVVKPARDKESSTILIPLFKSIETNRRLGTFPVELVYMERMSRMPKLAGKLDLRVPGADILANAVRWEVLVPETQRVYRSRGDVKPLESEQDASFRRRPMAAREATGTRRETAYRLREGIERFLITDVNNPAGSAMAMHPAGPSRSKRPPADIAVAGVLPVRIDLPVEGIAHYFKRTVVPQGKALELSLYTYNSGLRQVTRLALVGLGFFIGLTVGRLIFLRLVERRVAVRLVAAAIAGAALLVILRAAFDPEVGLAYVGIAVGIIMTLSPWFITRLAERRPTPKAQTEIQQEGA
jgi:hypothetical protein